MAVTSSKRTLTIIGVFFFLLFAAGITYSVIRLSSGLPIIPGESSAGGTGACGSYCTDASQCAGPNAICSFNQCYDAQECGDADEDDGGSSGGATDEIKCQQFDDSADAAGNDTFTVAQGEALSVELFTKVKTTGNEGIRGYKYKIDSKYGTLSPLGETDEASTTWTMTEAQSAALEEGTYKNAVEVSVKGKDDKDSCNVDLIVAAGTTGADWTVTKSNSTTCTDDDSEAAITYSIKVRNRQALEATVTSIVEELDDSITEDMIGTLTPSEGVYDSASNTITWDNDGTGYAIAADQTKTFTYTINMVEDEFTNLINVTTVTPADGSGTAPNETSTSYTVSCSLPDTAIISDFADRLIIALVLLLAGFIVFRYDLFNLVDLKAMAEDKREASKAKFESGTLVD